MVDPLAGGALLVASGVLATWATGEAVGLGHGHSLRDFPPEVSVAFRAVPDSTRDLLQDEHWVFLRREPED